jgi:hypothetical protein
MSEEIIFSCVIPASAKDAESQNLKDLIASIKAQDFPQDQIEILVITDGDSESAKGIGIKRAKGEICAMFCADNEITESDLFEWVQNWFSVHPEASGMFPMHYAYLKKDNSLNRYFSLIGGNDPVCYYLGKNDRKPWADSLIKKSNYQPSYGCNGFFYKSKDIKSTNLDNYYPMDNAQEVPGVIYSFTSSGIWHKTSDNLITFLKKRYKYARSLYCDRWDRRWRIIDTKEDRINLGIFIGCTILTIPTLLISARGFSKVRDPAWFWHPIVCWGFLITYTILALRNLLKYGRFFQCPQPSVS